MIFAFVAFLVAVIVAAWETFDTRSRTAGAICAIAVGLDIWVYYLIHLKILPIGI